MGGRRFILLTIFFIFKEIEEKRKDYRYMITLMLQINYTFTCEKLSGTGKTQKSGPNKSAIC